MAAPSSLSVSAIVPTYGRHEVLVSTVESLLALEPAPDEIVVVDQTPAHPADVADRLEGWQSSGRIRWLRGLRPSIPGAMNAGLLAAAGDLVLFLDDDVSPSAELVAAHRAAHRSWAGGIVSGQVLQPGERPALLEGNEFAFRSSAPQEIREFMAGNVSFRRALALSIGGFDERFVGAAYRFESDFAARAASAGARIWFEPSASLLHLRAERGGTRSFGEHLTSARPFHSVGEYYFLLRHRPSGTGRRLIARPWHAIVNRHHLRRPWWIPISAFAELSGFAWALSLAVRGPRLLDGPKRAMSAGAAAWR